MGRFVESGTGELVAAAADPADDVRLTGADPTAFTGMDGYADVSGLADVSGYADLAGHPSAGFAATDDVAAASYASATVDDLSPQSTSRQITETTTDTLETGFKGPPGSVNQTVSRTTETTYDVTLGSIVSPSRTDVFSPNSLR